MKYNIKLQYKFYDIMHVFAKTTSLVSLSNLGMPSSNTKLGNFAKTLQGKERDRTWIRKKYVHNQSAGHKR